MVKVLCLHAITLIVFHGGTESWCYALGYQYFCGLCKRRASYSFFICKAEPGAVCTPEKNQRSMNDPKGVIVDSWEHQGSHAVSSLLRWFHGDHGHLCLFYTWNSEVNYISLDWWLRFPTLFYELFRSLWTLSWWLTRSMKSFLWRTFS